MYKISDEEGKIIACNPLTIHASACKDAIEIIDALNAISNGLHAVMASNYNTMIGISVNDAKPDDFPRLAKCIKSYVESDQFMKDYWIPGVDYTEMQGMIEGIVSGLNTLSDKNKISGLVGSCAYWNAYNELGRAHCSALGDYAIAMDSFRARCLGSIVNWDIIADCFKSFAEICAPADKTEE